MALVALIVAAAGGRAQESAPRDTIAESRRLRDAGAFSAAAVLLRPYVEAHPDDPGTARFAALMAYWSKDARSARTIYERALERHPNDIELRLELGQFLVEVGDGARAREVLARFEQPDAPSPASARAHTLLGTLSYWSGDYSRARRDFIGALRLDSSNADARRQLREIETAAATWIRADGSLWRDDQPLRSIVLDVTAGWFASPLTPLTIRAGSTRFSRDGISETVSAGEATVATFLPRARLDVGVAAGVLRRSFGDANDWTGRASLGLRLPRHIALEARVERAPYFHTATSLATSVMTQTLESSVRWRPTNGWMADATARRETFEDDNHVSTGFLWALAPVMRRSGNELHLGYSFSAQSAAESRFVPRDEDLDFPPGQPPATIRGAYDPYFTPRNLRVHSALASARLRPSTRWALSGSATYGFAVHDDAPVFLVVPDPPNVDVVRTYYDRDFTPWNVRGGLDGPVSDAVRLTLTAEHGQGAFYSFTTATLRVTYTFVAAALRRADRY